MTFGSTRTILMCQRAGIKFDDFHLPVTLPPRGVDIPFAAYEFSISVR
jgi:hypothetical protein